MATCDYRDLFAECTQSASVAIVWRRWGRHTYCPHHAAELTATEPIDLMLMEVT